MNNELINAVAYVRVNEKYTDGANNLSNQIKSLMFRISKDETLNFRGVYVDEIKMDNTSTNDKGFNDLLMDAYNNKFELILTNSIYNFASNPKDTFKYIKLLRGIDIKIVFLKEKIDSLSEEGVKKITMLEKINIQNSLDRMSDITDGFRKRILKYNKIGNEKKYGYYIDEETDEWIINYDEAQVINKIFDLYLEGKGSETISHILYRENIKTPTGKDKWVCSQILYILQNETYIGDFVFGKTSSILVDNQFKTVVNEKVKDKYIIRNHHKPIVEKYKFEKVQELIKNKRTMREMIQTVPCTHSCFSKRMRCGFCGGSMRVRGRDAARYYSCDIRRYGTGNFCDKYKSIKVDVLKDLWIETINKYRKNKTMTKNLSIMKYLYYFNDEIESLNLQEFNENDFSRLIQCVICGDKESDNPYHIKFIINVSAFENPWISKDDVINNEFIEIYKFESKYKRSHLFYGNLLADEDVNYTVSLLVRNYSNGNN